MNESSGSTAGIDIRHLEQWTRNEPVILTETLEQRPASGLAAMLDQSECPGIGEALPPLWQWVYFTPVTRTSELGTDGHPVLGGFLPPVPLPRRMWAASKFRFNAPLRIGETVQKQSRVDSVKLKQGSSGPLVFVNIEHSYLVAGELRISEQQALVYTGKKRGRKPETKAETHIGRSDWSRSIQPDPVLLFRYSALTSNTHRIHYDRDYAVNEEGHPGLLVHAPLTATLMAELLREHCPGVRIKQFSFRALLPLVDSVSFKIHGRREGKDSVALWALDGDGQLAVQANARVIES